MASNLHSPSDPSPEALAAVLRVLQSVDARLGRLEGRMASVVPRRHITDAVKRQHVDVVGYLGGRCPCCGVTEVVDMGGRVLEPEFDHFYSRERRDFTET